MISRLLLLSATALVALGQVAEAPPKGLALPPSQAELRKQAGIPGQRVFSLIHAYEPNEGGYTVDQADDSFLDFTFSLFIPVMRPSTYPSGTQSGSLTRPLSFRPAPTPFFAM